MLGKRWRDFKSELKVKYCKVYKTKEERLQHRDLRVEEEQWPKLIDYWSTSKAKKLSRRNKKTRKRQKMGNASGRKSHARVRDEILQKTGCEPSKMDVYIVTRKKKNGEPIDNETAEAIEKFTELLNEEPEDVRSEGSVKNKIFDQVMGPEKPGRVRTYGLGPTPSQVFGLSSRYTRVGHSSMEETIRASVRETITEQYREEILEDIRQGGIVEKLREDFREQIRQEVREEVREDVREEVREEVRQEECDKLRQQLRGEMEFMMQEMLRSRFDQMRHDQMNTFPSGNTQNTVPSVNTQVPDASSSHRLASNNGIGSEPLQLKKLNISANSRDCSPEINQDKNQNKMKKKHHLNELTQDKTKKKHDITEDTWKKICQAKKKKKHDDVNHQGDVLVNLLDYKGPKQVVAKGILISKDASKVVGGAELGNEFWEVLIKEVIKPSERLIRPFEGVTKLGEAIEKSVAWRNMDITRGDGSLLL